MASWQLYEAGGHIYLIDDYSPVVYKLTKEGDLLITIGNKDKPSDIRLLGSAGKLPRNSGPLKGITVDIDTLAREFPQNYGVGSRYRTTN